MILKVKLHFLEYNIHSGKLMQMIGLIYLQQKSFAQEIYVYFLFFFERRRRRNRFSSLQIYSVQLIPRISVISLKIREPIP